MKFLIIFLDDNNEVKEIFSEAKVFNNYVEVITDRNKLIIPWHRILKMKERGDGSE